MKQAFAVSLYVAFLLLALRVHGATPGPAARLANANNPIEQANTCLRHYRETARAEFIDQAQAAITAALATTPNDYVAQRTEVAILLARHADSAALERSTALNRRFPDDVDTYALMIDAELALGRYTQAEQDTQRLLDLRPDNVPGLIRAAHLRELYGDWQGAIDFINASLNRVTEDEAEQRASLYTQLARLHFGAGHGEIARQALAAALTALPDYHLGLEEGLRIARLSDAHDEALHNAQRLYRVVPSENHLFLLARATAEAGDTQHAAAMFSEFVTRAQNIQAKDDTTTLALSAYYADEGRDPTRAVTLATAVRAARADAPTVLALAWALHRAGHDDAALCELDTLANLGWRDADFLAALGEIHAAITSQSVSEPATHS